MTSPSPPQTPLSKRKVSTHLRIRQLLPSGWGSEEDNDIVLGTRSTPTSPKSERRRRSPPPSAFAELSRSVNSLLNIHREQVDGDRRGDGLLPRLVVTDEDGVQTSSDGDSSATSSRSASPSKVYPTRKYSDSTGEMRGRSNSTSLAHGDGRRKSQSGGSSSSTSNLLTAVLNRTLRKKYFHHLLLDFLFSSSSLLVRNTRKPIMVVSPGYAAS